MAVPVWNRSFAVNVKRCDEDHKKLFALLQRLHDTVEPLPERSVALEAIQELDEYTKAHFSAEEALLEQTNYPALASHRLQHHTFIAKVEELKQLIDFAPGTTKLAMVEYLKNWLVRHIKLADRKYSAHLNSNGIQ
jgi:hemerythrin